MSTKRTATLLDVLERCRVKRFTGRVSLDSISDELSVWFVRGSLTHAETSTGETGWKALESVKSALTVTARELAGELPPQRTIRVETVRLINAMRSFQKVKPAVVMHVPVPFHARLRIKFAELQKKVSGLQSFETTRRSDVDGVETQAPHGDLDQRRTIVEKDPRGSRWTYCFGSERLVVTGDESVSTTELMWAGAELQREMDRLRKSAVENER